MVLVFTAWYLSWKCLPSFDVTFFSSLQAIDNRWVRTCKLILLFLASWKLEKNADNNNNNNNNTRKGCLCVCMSYKEQKREEKNCEKLLIKRKKDKLSKSNQSQQRYWNKSIFLYPSVFLSKYWLLKLLVWRGPKAVFFNLGSMEPRGSANSLLFVLK